MKQLHQKQKIVTIIQIAIWNITRILINCPSGIGYQVKIYLRRNYFISHKGTPITSLRKAQTKNRNVGIPPKINFDLK